MANEKYYAEWTAAKIFIIKRFDPTLQIAKLWCKAQDDRFQMQHDDHDPICTNLMGLEV